MKKLSIVALFVFILLILSGCSEPKKADTKIKKQDALGNTFVTSEKGTEISVSQLPCAIAFNSKEIYLKKIELSESKNENGTYSLYSYVWFDVSELSEDELNDFARQKLSVSSYIDCPTNGADFSPMLTLGKFLYTDTKELIWISTDNSLSIGATECYYSFKNDSGFDYSLFIDVEQTERYQYTLSSGKPYSTNKENHLSYFPNTSTIKEFFIDADSVDPQIESYITEQLLKILGRMIEYGF